MRAVPRGKRATSTFDSEEPIESHKKFCRRNTNSALREGANSQFRTEKEGRAKLLGGSDKEKLFSSKDKKMGAPPKEAAKGAIQRGGRKSSRKRRRGRLLLKRGTRVSNLTGSGACANNKIQRRRRDHRPKVGPLGGAGEIFTHIRRLRILKEKKIRQKSIRMEDPRPWGATLKAERSVPTERKTRRLW